MESERMIMGYTQQQIILAVATAIGAFGGFPAPPRVFMQLTQNEIVQWALVFVLIFQGGGAQDPKLCLLITAAMYAATQALNNL